MVKGSALLALEKLTGGCVAKDTPECQCIFELMDAVDSYIPDPERATDKPFLMPVEDVFSITGRDVYKRQALGDSWRRGSRGMATPPRGCLPTQDRSNLSKAPCGFEGPFPIPACFSPANR